MAPFGRFFIRAMIAFAVGTIPVVAQAQTAKNLVCKGCVGGRDLAKKSVKTNKIAPGAVTPDKIAPGAVTPDKLSAPTGAAGTESVSKSLITENEIVTKIAVDIPNPGVVVVNASGYYRFRSDGARGLCTITKDTVGAEPFMFSTGGTAADDEGHVFAGSRAFVETQGGIKTYNLVCSPDGGDLVDVFDAVMTAIYAPTNILASP